ncbi:MAG TPA: aldo/keto reductase [Vicinamibacteria bacterium]|nr:aldo/keto reductase [Vicinamibacteria bacterium]
MRPSLDGVDPALVPKKRLATGAEVPVVGLGTFGSDHVDAATVADAVRGAAEVGYRHFDCASVYGNEAEIGRALRDVLRSGVRRQELWVTSKLWNDKHGEGQVAAACEQSLRDLRLDHLDLYLVHWPFPNYHPPGCDVTARSPDARPYLHQGYLQTWRQMEALVRRGLVHHIGTSNMTIPKLELLLHDAEIAPVANEMELHPHFQQPQLLRYLVEQGIVPVGYSPVGSPGRPARDRTPQDTAPTEDPVIVAIAGRHGVHPAEVCLRWGIQRGHVVIPFSANRAHYLANLRSAVSAPLADADMKAIAGIGRNCRLIKGQVFLWPGARSWEELWD